MPDIQSTTAPASRRRDALACHIRCVMTSPAIAGWLIEGIPESGPEDWEAGQSGAVDGEGPNRLGAAGRFPIP